MNRIFYTLLLPIICFDLGCSDYNLFEKPQAEDAELLPVLVVEPSELDLGTVCEHSLEDSSYRLDLYNQGMGILEIAALEIEGWVLLNNPCPIEVYSGEGIALAVRPQETGESGVLTVYSNDPNQDIQQIPLNAIIDRAPELELVSPVSGDILDGETRFEALVSDDIDPTEYLMVQWQSNQDGLFSTGEAFADGTVSTMWNQYHSSGYHNIEVGVVDSCNNVTRESATICQQLTYDVNALDVNTWNFEGNASWDETNNWVQLTPAQRWQVGTAFSTGQEVPAGWIDIQFDFYIGDGNGADGISLTALDVARMNTFLGGTGCGIGYGGDGACTDGPALPGWSIEVDTYYNDGYDPTADDHLMFTFDGDVDDPAAWAVLPEMEDTGWHTMAVRVQQPHVQVSIDGVTYIDQEILGFYDFDAYIGFTAGTGDYTNRHLIKDLVVQEKLCGD
jgi:hypothetical protein